MNGTSNVMRRTKGPATKTPVSCPNIIKIYNESTGGVDVIHQKTAAYQLDRKSRFRFYLRIFSSLIGITIVNSRIVYTKVGNSISLLDFKIVVVKSLLGRYINQQRSFCFLFEQNKQPKSTGDITSKGNTNTPAGIQLEVHAMQFLQKWRSWPWKICISNDLWSVLALYQREKLLSKTLCLDFIQHIYCNFVKHVI